MKAGGDVLPIVADASKVGDMERFIDEAVMKFFSNRDHACGRPRAHHRALTKACRQTRRRRSAH